MKPLLKLKNISKVFHLDGITVNAVKDVSLDIKMGEFAAIVGPSGSGKSTLMHIIGCLSKPSSGQYFFEDKDISKLSDDQLAEIRNTKIGFVFQSFNLLPRISALSNVELPLIYTRLKEKVMKEIALEKLKNVGLEKRVQHHSNQLSGGEQQRVAIARALVNNPKLILADEPTGNLDTKSGKDIIKIFKKLNSQGQTIIIVTHDMDLAKMTNRIIKIVDGVIVKDKKHGSSR
ncbi:ABC transporter ATP-binding protein [Patescibacteria group bacterium]